MLPSNLLDRVIEPLMLIYCPSIPRCCFVVSLLTLRGRRTLEESAEQNSSRGS